MTPRGTVGLCCVYIDQLMTYLTVYTSHYGLPCSYVTNLLA